MISLSILFALCISSCGNKKAASNDAGLSEKPFSSLLSAEDTTLVLNKARTCMDKLRAGQIEEALGMISVLDGRNVQPLSEEMKQTMKKRFSFFPVVNYTLDYFSFTADSVNDIKYAVEFTERTKGKTPNTIGLMFNPVKKDGKWYLTIKQATQDAFR